MHSETKALKCKTFGVVCVPKSRFIRHGHVMCMLDKINDWVGSCNLLEVVGHGKFSIKLGHRRLSKKGCIYSHA